MGKIRLVHRTLLTVQAEIHFFFFFFRLKEKGIIIKPLRIKKCHSVIFIHSAEIFVKARIILLQAAISLIQGVITLVPY